MQTKRIIRNALVTALIVAALIFSYNVTEVDFSRLLSNLPNGREIVLSFMSPDVVTRDVETRTISIAFPIPSGAAPQGDVIPTGVPRLVPSGGCPSPPDKRTR